MSENKPAIDGANHGAADFNEKPTSTPQPVADVQGTHASNASTSSQESLYGINEKALVRKLDYKLLPALTLLYLLSFLDRSNVGNARIEGLVADLGITGNEYLTSLTLFCMFSSVLMTSHFLCPTRISAQHFVAAWDIIGYVLFEVPCQIILKLWTPRMWLPTLTLAWGVVSTLMGVTQDKAGFFVVRFFLGVSESGLFPGIVYYLSLWYKREERHYRVSLFFGAAALAGAFGGILAWGIAHMRGVGGYNGWRWIFILEGLLTVFVAIAAYFFIHNYPSTARFLSDSERDVVQRRLKADSDATDDESFNWSNVKKALTDIKVYLYCFGFHTLSLPLYTLSLFLPSIIRDLGYTSAQAQLFTIPPYAIAFVTTMSVAVLSERYKRRAPFIVGSSSVAIIGYILLISDHRAGPSYTGTILAAAGIYPAVALTLAWPAQNVSGQTKRAVANGLQISIGNLGAILGTQLYRTQTAPHYYLGHAFALAYLLANIGVTSIQWIVLRRANAAKDRERKAADADEDAGKNGEGDGDRDRPFTGDDDVRWRFTL